MVDSSEQILWERWRKRHDNAARDSLVVMHSPWARMVARDVFMRIRFLGDVWPDCVQNALIGLLESVDRFDPDRGIKFQSYARHRVRGAVFNGLRYLRESLAQSDRTRNHVSTIVDRVESFEEEGADPFEEFVSTVTGLGIGFLLDARSFPDHLAAHDAYAELERAELGTAIAGALEQLTERDRSIISLHYYHHMSFVDIASHLGVTKGRVSQLHKRILGQLRALLHSRVIEEY